MAAAWLVLGALASAPAVTRYVDVNSTQPQPPFLAQGQAARTIQDAADVSSAGDVILVAPGTYAEGGAVLSGQQVTSRVALIHAVLVRSMEGPSATRIVGKGPAGDSAVRGVFMTAGAELYGFTVVSGATRVGESFWTPDCSGGGIYMDGNATVTGCVVAFNSASFGAGIFCASGRVVNSSILTNTAVLSPASGGGVYCVAGRVSDCDIRGNTATYGGGVFCDEFGEVKNCTIWKNRSMENAGGVFITSNGTVRNCQISGNTASKLGGGFLCWKAGTLRNLLILTNTASQGGGVYLDRGGVLQSCTVARNAAIEAGGGLYAWSTGEVWNTILYNNTAPGPSNYAATGNGPRYAYTCTAPLPANSEFCLSLSPQFEKSGSYRLGASSPCLDAGLNQAWMPFALDNESRPRLWIDRVDIGALERNPTDLNADSDGDGIPDAWEWQYYGHVTNVPPWLDGDEDGAGAYQEYVAGTDPLSASSVFQVAGVRNAQGRHVIQWPSVEGRLYTLSRCTNLLNQADAVLLASDLPATPPMNSHTDLVSSARSHFYILQVRKP